MDAEQKLRNLSFSDADLERIARSNDTSNQLEIIAPIDGLDHALGRHARVRRSSRRPSSSRWSTRGRCGSGSTSTSPTSPPWQSDSQWHSPSRGPRRPVFSGKVTSVGMEVNPITRTTRVRAELANPGGRLRANQFGQASIQVEPEHEALVVPVAAVQDDGKSERCSCR